jgi:hypothetical protein
MAATSVGLSLSLRLIVVIYLWAVALPSVCSASEALNVRPACCLSVRLCAGRWFGMELEQRASVPERGMRHQIDRSRLFHSLACL